MHIQHINSRLIASISGLLAIASAILALTVATLPASAAIDNTPDCDNVAIIKCGAFSESALKAAYDKNSYGDLKKVYDAFGISRSDMTGFVSGIVYRNGNVTVAGKVVATDAMTAGRNYGGTPISGTKNVGKYSVSKFVDEGQTAFVKISNGEFEFAIIKACSNPVSAKPVEKPTPKPEPKPVYACEDLTYKKISRTEYQFTATGSADNGAKITGYSFDFGDGKSQVVTSQTVDHTYSTDGPYVIKAKVRVAVDGSSTFVGSNDCIVKIDVAPLPPPNMVEVCDPATGQIITVDEADKDNYKPVDDPACGDITVCRLADNEIITIKDSEFDANLHSKDIADCQEEPAPEELPITGPTDFIFGGLGVSSITAASYYLHASRRKLLGTLLDR